jgi:hypothetical protein
MDNTSYDENSNRSHPSLIDYNEELQKQCLILKIGCLYAVKKCVTLFLLALVEYGLPPLL